jgi:type IV pilus assembly protein PilP
MMAFLVGVSFLSVAANAQAPRPTAPPAPPVPPAAAGQAPRAGVVPMPSPPPMEETYTYQPEGRRDPFLSLIDSGVERGAKRGGEGPASLSANEITVRGVMLSRGTMVAMIQGPDNKTYIVHQGDKLLDGTIKSITSQGIVVDQQVNDPLSIVKHREITRLLRSLESGKE